MCRNIVNLRVIEQAVTREDYHNAALQYVRKVSGYRKPSKANQETFDQAVAEIAAITEALVEMYREKSAASNA